MITYIQQRLFVHVPQCEYVERKRVIMTPTSLLELRRVSVLAIDSPGFVRSVAFVLRRQPKVDKIVDHWRSVQAVSTSNEALYRR